ncbi:hypothetical protein Sjap_005677 [Stephania japonica]|uniref:Uncharacterized protein n=1 Tax=Stephania japonica TaxID=461633 RepID=A0AAP0K661_9MAGN
MAVIDEEIADVDASRDVRGSHSEDGARPDRVYSPFCVLWSLGIVIGVGDLEESNWDLGFGSVESSASDDYIFAEIKTRNPNSISLDYIFRPVWSTPVSSVIKSSALKKAIDDLQWPGSSIQITLRQSPPRVSFTAEAGGDNDGEIQLQVLQITLAEYMHIFAWPMPANGVVEMKTCCVERDSEAILLCWSSWK